MAELIVLGIIAAIVAYAIYRSSRPGPSPTGGSVPDDSEKPYRPIDRR